MAVGDVSMPQMHVVKGVKIGSAEAYVRYQNRRDLVIFEFAEAQMLRVFLLKMHSAQRLCMYLKAHLTQ